jgi:hypothetical protein
VTGIAATPKLHIVNITTNTAQHSTSISYHGIMAKTLVGALALAALPSALAFRNTSPFFLFSTAEYVSQQLHRCFHTNIGSLNLPSTDASVAGSSQITTDVLEALKDCPTRSYAIIEQGGVSSADFVDGRSMPRLSHYMGGKNDKIKATFAVPDVVGNVDSQAIAAHLKSKCGHKTEISVIAAPGPDKAQRMRSLQSAGTYQNMS